MTALHRQRLARPARVALLLAALSACKDTADTATPPPTASSGEIALGADSPKLAYIASEPVLVRHERTVAILPAQLILDEARTVRVTSPVTGRAQTVDALLGATVHRGDVLARLMSGDLAQAQSDLVKARAAAAQSAAALVRTRDLFEHKVAAAKDLEQAKSDDAQARAEVDRAAARGQSFGEQAQDISGLYVLRAPIDGTVVERSLSAGTEVRPDAAAPLFVISNIDTLWLTANVAQRDLPNVRPGSQLEFTTEAVPNRRFAAVVTYVSNSLDASTRTATVRATVANPGGSLRAQTAGAARLTTPSIAPLIVVPDVALVTQGSETVVFVELARGRYERRVVTTADDDGTFAVVVSGLQSGERVVTTGTLQLAAEADRRR
ncbi:MAG: efflux RND transporter periplasmic adaptor subunit [Gemmatimonadaceae bacterium]